MVQPHRSDERSERQQQQNATNRVEQGQTARVGRAHDDITRRRTRPASLFHSGVLSGSTGSRRQHIEVPRHPDSGDHTDQRDTDGVEREPSGVDNPGRDASLLSRERVHRTAQRGRLGQPDAEPDGGLLTTPASRRRRAPPPARTRAIVNEAAIKRQLMAFPLLSASVNDHRVRIGIDCGFTWPHLADQRKSRTSPPYGSFLNGHTVADPSVPALKKAAYRRLIGSSPGSQIGTSGRRRPRSGSACQRRRSARTTPGRQPGSRTRVSVRERPTPRPR
jgi:hypothetical protein